MINSVLIVAFIFAQLQAAFDSPDGKRAGDFDLVRETVAAAEARAGLEDAARNEANPEAPAE